MSKISDKLQKLALCNSGVCVLRAIIQSIPIGIVIEDTTFIPPRHPRDSNAAQGVPPNACRILKIRIFNFWYSYSRKSNASHQARGHIAKTTQQYYLIIINGITLRQSYHSILPRWSLVPSRICPGSCAQGVHSCMTPLYLIFVHGLIVVSGGS